MFRSVFYNAGVKTWDTIIIGGGIIGLSLAIALRKRGATVLVVERGEPGREASHAAGGMLVDHPLETLPALRPLATASARMYPEFARELEVESGMKVDLRDYGTILYPDPQKPIGVTSARLSPDRLAELEPALAQQVRTCIYLKERSVDPRALTAAAWKTAKNLGVDFSSGDPVGVVNRSGHKFVVFASKTRFVASKVVNCAGAWSGQIRSTQVDLINLPFELPPGTGKLAPTSTNQIVPDSFPTRPVKGQMLCLAMPSRELIKHVIRTPEVYLIPRSDGRLLVGATVEEAGFDKRTDAATMQRFHRAAIALVPKLADAKILEDWAGLRPGTPDGLPILGATATPGYYVATGHFRDGILLAPITAHVMSRVIEGRDPEHDLSAFSPARFRSASL